MIKSKLWTGIAILIVVAVLAYIGFSQTPTKVTVGTGVTNSSSVFGQTKPNVFAKVEKDYGKLRLGALGEFKGEPELPTLLQADRADAKQDGSELRLRPTVDYRIAGPIYAGIGMDYYRQFYPENKYGPHYSTGLNPLTTVGARFGNHDLSVTRIWQEFKLRGFKYYTFREVEYVDKHGREHYKYVPVENLQNKGTFNPAYLDGWMANYSYVRPIKGYKVYFGAEAKYLEYQKAVDRKYISYYLQSDAIFTGRVGLQF